MSFEKSSTKFFKSGSIVNSSIMHATCGSDIELLCPIRSMENSHEVVYS